MEQNNLSLWHKIKIKISKNKNFLKFNEREIWFIRLGQNIGFEQNGKGEQFMRPTLIFKKFSNNTFLGIPLTTQHLTGKFYASFKLKNKTSIAILSQIRLFDTKRLAYYYGRITEIQFLGIKEKLIQLIG